MTVGGQDMRTKIGRFDILIIVSYRHLKNSKCSEKLFLNSLICLKTEPLPGGTQWSQVPSPGVSPAGEDWLLSQETRLEVNHTQTHFVTNLIPPMYCSKGPFIFPKYRLLSFPQEPTPYPLSLLRWYVILSSKPSCRVGRFSLCISYAHIRDTC